jgi:hypothetical protein
LSPVFQGASLVISGKERVERRKHKRFQVQGGAFVGLGPHFETVGPIMNVSLGGLGFRYIGSEEPNGSYLDMFLTDEYFYLRNIRFKTIWHMKTVNKAPSDSLTMRRTGVQFKKLKHNQRSQLEYFIENYAIGEA